MTDDHAMLLFKGCLSHIFLKKPFQNTYHNSYVLFGTEVYAIICGYNPLDKSILYILIKDKHPCLIGV